MDGTTCLKSLLLAIRHYKNDKSVFNSSQLQKHIQDVSGQTFSRILSSCQVLPSECLSGLLEVAGDPNTDCCLTGRIVALLAECASDAENVETLHSSFNITGTLASIIHCNRATPLEPLVLQCLQVLQRLTYNVRIVHCMSYIDELISFLMQNIQSTDDDVTRSCLGLLANLCRHNLSVQAHIKCQSNVKAFYRTLTKFLGHKCLTVVIFALSILSILALNEDVGQKLFSAQNICQTFQMIFNITVNGVGTLTRNYAVDLLVDLIKNAKIADYLTKYKHLRASVSEVLGLLHGKDLETAAKVLELLVALCSVPALRRLLVEIVFQPARPRLQPGARKGAHSRGPDACLALLQLATGPLDGPERCYLLALTLLTELFEEVIDSSLSGSVHSFAELLLPALLELLRSWEGAQGQPHLRRHCVRAGRAVDLLLVLCGEDVLKMLLAQHVGTELCASQVELLLSHAEGEEEAPGSASSDSLSQVCSEVVLKTLELMSQLKQQVSDMETAFYRILQDQRMVTPLSLALSSNHRHRVQMALRILFEAAPLPDFPSLLLGESIAANNAYHQREAERVGRSLGQEELSTTARVIPFPVHTPTSPALHNIDNLIERLQGGIELQEHSKDTHVSEIIDVYEQKLSALASKEGHLQDLLEAKALALAQADRLIAQCRCQRTQAEAEARKLASLLKEAERRKEELQTELGSQRLEAECMRTDTQQLLQNNSRLQAVSEEHHALKNTYNELLSRFNSSDRMLKELQAAHIHLTQQAEGLRKSNDGLRQQQERVLAEVAEKEQRIEALQTRVQEKDHNISDLQSDLEGQEKRAADLEENLGHLRKELNKSEQARKDASIKASSLELQKAQLETKLQKKEEELTKHTHMIAMIHNLSSGKVKNDATTNLSL